MPWQHQTVELIQLEPLLPAFAHAKQVRAGTRLDQAHAQTKHSHRESAQMPMVCDAFPWYVMDAQDACTNTQHTHLHTQHTHAHTHTHTYTHMHMQARTPTRAHRHTDTQSEHMSRTSARTFPW